MTGSEVGERKGSGSGKVLGPDAHGTACRRAANKAVSADRTNLFLLNIMTSTILSSSIQPSPFFN